MHGSGSTFAVPAPSFTGGLVGVRAEMEASLPAGSGTGMSFDHLVPKGIVEKNMETTNYYRIVRQWWFRKASVLKRKAPKPLASFLGGRIAKPLPSFLGGEARSSEITSFTCCRAPGEATCFILRGRSAKLRSY